VPRYARPNASEMRSDGAGRKRGVGKMNSRPVLAIFAAANFAPVKLARRKEKFYFNVSLDEDLTHQQEHIFWQFPLRRFCHHCLPQMMNNYQLVPHRFEYP